MANALIATGREDPLGPEPLAGMDVADGVAATSAQRIAFESTTPSVRNALRGTDEEDLGEDARLQERNRRASCAECAGIVLSRGLVASPPSVGMRCVATRAPHQSGAVNASLAGNVFAQTGSERRAPSAELGRCTTTVRGTTSPRTILDTLYQMALPS